jgi:hypothetical protein
MISTVFITISDGQRKLMIDGSLDLLQKFLTIMVESPNRPDPCPEPIYLPKGAIS